MSEQLPLFEDRTGPYIPVYMRPNIKQIMHEALERQALLKLEHEQEVEGAYEQ